MIDPTVKANVPATPVQPKQEGGGKVTAPDKREELVNAAKANTTEEQIANFGNKAETLSFVRALGFASHPSTYADREKVSHVCPDVVGAVFVSTEPVKVPRLPISVNTKTGIKPEDISWEDVAAGTEFEVTMMEAAVLLTQEQYSGTFMYDGEKRGMFAAKFPALNKGAKFPTPHFLIKEYQYKAHSQVIDIEQADGTWTIDPAYARYAPLLEKPKGKRGGSKGKSDKLSNADKTAMAVRQLIFG